MDHKNQLQQKPFIIWFTGLSGSGKTTLANAIEYELYKKGKKTFLLDGDILRKGLNKDLGFSNDDRVENIRRVAEVCKILLESGLIVITAFISPFKSDREIAKNLVNQDEFIEVFVDAPLDVCEQRDPKGLYKKARGGLIKDFTGIDSPYEIPIAPHVHIKSDELSINDSVELVLTKLRQLLLI